MINYLPHCRSKVHCHKCGKLPANQRRIFGTAFECPFPEGVTVTDDMVTAEIERQKKQVENAERWKIVLATAMEAESRDPDVKELLAIYYNKPCCSAKRMILQWYEARKVDDSRTLTQPSEGI